MWIIYLLAFDSEGMKLKVNDKIQFTFKIDGDEDWNDFPPHTISSGRQSPRCHLVLTAGGSSAKKSKPCILYCVIKPSVVIIFPTLLS